MERYFGGIDPCNKKGSYGSIVIARETENGIEIIKVVQWFNRWKHWKWVQRLRYRLLIRKIAKQYKGIKFYHEII